MFLMEHIQAVNPKPKRKADLEVLAEVRAKPCCICGRWPSDPSHVKSRGSGGPDTPWNVVPMCREHHREWHQIGPSKFLRKYPPFEFLLKYMGWEIETGRLRHPAMIDC